MHGCAQAGVGKEGPPMDIQRLSSRSELRNPDMKEASCATAVSENRGQALMYLAECCHFAIAIVPVAIAILPLGSGGQNLAEVTKRPVGLI